MEDDLGTCPSCGLAVLPEDGFCEACGHALTDAGIAVVVAAGACTGCGAVTIDADGYCEQCGIRQRSEEHTLNSSHSLTSRMPSSA